MQKILNVKEHHSFIRENNKLFAFGDRKLVLETNIREYIEEYRD